MFLFSVLIIIFLYFFALIVIQFKITNKQTFTYSLAYLQSHKCNLHTLSPPSRFVLYICVFLLWFPNSNWFVSTFTLSLWVLIYLLQKKIFIINHLSLFPVFTSYIYNYRIIYKWVQPLVFFFFFGQASCILYATVYSYFFPTSN